MKNCDEIWAHLACFELKAFHKKRHAPICIPTFCHFYRAILQSIELTLTEEIVDSLWRVTQSRVEKVIKKLTNLIKSTYTECFLPLFQIDHLLFISNRETNRISITIVKILIKFTEHPSLTVVVRNAEKSFNDEVYKLNFISVVIRTIKRKQINSTLWQSP